MEANTTELTTEEAVFVIPQPVMIILQYIIPYILVVLMPMGILGNLASLYIFYKKRKEDRASTHYLTTLAVFDIITISYIGIPLWMFVNLETVSFGKYKFQTQAPTDLWCKITNYTYNVCAFMSGWILITFSTERLLVIWQPLKMAPLVASGKPRKIALFCLFIFAVFECSGHLIWTRLLPTTEGRALPAKCKHDPIRYSAAGYVIWYNASCFILTNGLPLVIISIENILILITLKRSQMTEGKNRSANAGKSKDMKAVMNLLCVSACYITFVTPFEAMYLTQTYLENSGQLNVAQSPGFVQLWLTADTWHYFNYICNPFIYVWSLPYYKKEIKKILACGRADQDSSSGSSATT